jgi:hypothetical protein
MDKYAIETLDHVFNKSTPGCSLGPNWLAKLKQNPNENQVSLLFKP